MVTKRNTQTRAMWFIAILKVVIEEYMLTFILVIVKIISLWPGDVINWNIRLLYKLM